MSNDGTLSMHPDFARWYRAVTLDADRNVLHLRYQGVCDLLKSVTREQIEAMIRVVFRAKQAPSPELIDQIRKPFKEADDVFEMSGNTRELEVLCGASLAILMESKGDIAARAALALTTSAMNGARPLDLPMDLPSLSESAITRIAEHDRRRPDFGEYVRGAAVEVDFNAAKAKVQAQADATGFIAAFDAAAQAVNAAFTASTRRSAEVVQNIKTFFAIQDEELQMLWWLFGERSLDLNLRFQEVSPVERQPLLFAKELAEATQFLPGPRSAKSLLARAGLKEEASRITITAAVNACDVGWLRSLGTQQDVSAVSSPIHSAVFRKLETCDDTSWIPGWSAVSEIPPDFSLSPLTLGNLFYRERLLALFE